MLWVYFLFVSLLVIILFGSILFYQKCVKHKTWKKKLLCALPILVYGIVIVIVAFFWNHHLSYVESQVVNQTIALIEDEEFLNPQEVRLLEAVVGYEYDDFNRSYTEDIQFYFFKVVGTNMVGGTINTCYWSYYNDAFEDWVFRDEDCDDIYQNGARYEQLSTDQIRRINRALRQHWIDLGL